MPNSAAPDSPSQDSLQRGTLASIQVGRPRNMLLPSATDQRPVAWTSGIFKSATASPVQITASGIEGDGQADLENHGGPDNVVLAYDAAHYPVWRQRLSLPDLAPGAFGENFTVTGFSDDTVCIGDLWHVGPELLLQVTQARQPCFKLARRLGQPDIVRMVRENSWGGWYLRVLRAGHAAAGMDIRRTTRTHPDWPVARAVQVMYQRKINPAPARQLAALPELSTRWKQELLV